MSQDAKTDSSYQCIKDIHSNSTTPFKQKRHEKNESLGRRWNLITGTYNFELGMV
jgi:hypothetical protein